MVNNRFTQVFWEFVCDHKQSWVELYNDNKRLSPFKFGEYGWNTLDRIEDKCGTDIEA